MAAGYDRRICLCEAAVRPVEAFWSKNLMGTEKAGNAAESHFCGF
nr:MAG TPA: hypothetical protein [Caudoviricetes sp.]